MFLLTNTKRCAKIVEKYKLAWSRSILFAMHLTPLSSFSSNDFPYHVFKSSTHRSSIYKFVCKRFCKGKVLPIIPAFTWRFSNLYWSDRQKLNALKRRTFSHELLTEIAKQHHQYTEDFDFAKKNYPFTATSLLSDAPFHFFGTLLVIYPSINLPQSTDTTIDVTKNRTTHAVADLPKIFP